MANPCCSNREPRDFEVAIVPDQDDGLLWRWKCPVCGRCRYEEFAFPSDMPVDF